MIVLVATFYAKAGNGPAVEAALKRMAPLVQEHEQGCLKYQAQRSVEDENVFLIYEQYRDDAALQEHRNTPHFKELIEGVVLPLLDKRERELYTPIH